MATRTSLSGHRRSGRGLNRMSLSETHVGQYGRCDELEGTFIRTEREVVRLCDGETWLVSQHRDVEVEVYPEGARFEITVEN